jgi:hypothetical protein
MNSREFQSEKTKIPLKFIQFTKMPLGFWPNYRNTLGLLAKLPKYHFEVGMGFFGFWAFSILVFFGLLIFN